MSERVLRMKWAACHLTLKTHTGPEVVQARDIGNKILLIIEALFESRCLA